MALQPQPPLLKGSVELYALATLKRMTSATSALMKLLIILWRLPENERFILLIPDYLVVTCSFMRISNWLTTAISLFSLPRLVYPGTRGRQPTAAGGCWRKQILACQSASIEARLYPPHYTLPFGSLFYAAIGSLKYWPYMNVTALIAFYFDDISIL